MITAFRTPLQLSTDPQQLGQELVFHRGTQQIEDAVSRAQLAAARQLPLEHYTAQLEPLPVTARTQLSP